MNFTESIVEDAAVNETLLPKLISGELRVRKRDESWEGQQCEP